MLVLQFSEGISYGNLCLFIIARTFKIPSIILNNIFDIASKNNNKFVNIHTEEIYINLSISAIHKFIERGD